MKAVLLAAGRGTRLKRLTRDRPKCMVRLLGRMLLDWQLVSLRAAGVDDLVLVRGYRGELLCPPGVATVDNPAWETTNMVSSLRCAEPKFLGEPVLVSYTDILYPSGAIKALIASQADIAITYDTDWYRLWELRSALPLGDAETFRIDEYGRILEIGGKPATREEVMGQYMGLLKFSPKGWAWARAILDGLTDAESRTLQMTELLAKLIAAGRPVIGVPIHGRWVEVDTADDIELYSRLLESKPVGAWHHDWREEAAWVAE